MNKAIDITGRRFGLLIALRKAGQTANSEVRWECRCACGNFHVARVSHLRRGAIQSCGCHGVPPVVSRNTPACEHTPKTYHGLCSACYQRAWIAARPGLNAKYADAYQKRHPGRKRLLERLNYTPEKGAAHVHKRRALIQGNGGSFTAQEWLTLKRQYGHRCVGCWKTERQLKVLGRKLVPDHIVSLAKGGMNDITNIQPLCHGKGGCNNKKGKKYLDFVIS